MRLPATPAPTRCRATDATLLEAIQRTRPALDAAGVTVSVTKTLVAGEAQADALGFASSPTIRIDGVDIAGELVESACDSGGESCACNGGAGAGEAASSPPPGSGTVPASLRRYFAATGAEDKAACCGEGVAAAGCGCQA
jgi:Domain of unknown function (DUF2703)